MSAPVRHKSALPFIFIYSNSLRSLSWRSTNSPPGNLWGPALLSYLFKVSGDPVHSQVFLLTVIEQIHTLRLYQRTEWISQLSFKSTGEISDEYKIGTFCVYTGLTYSAVVHSMLDSWIVPLTPRTLAELTPRPLQSLLVWLPRCGCEGAWRVFHHGEHQCVVIFCAL